MLINWYITHNCRVTTSEAVAQTVFDCPTSIHGYE